MARHLKAFSNADSRGCTRRTYGMVAPFELYLTGMSTSFLALILLAAGSCCSFLFSLSAKRHREGQRDNERMDVRCLFLVVLLVSLMVHLWAAVYLPARSG